MFYYLGSKDSGLISQKIIFIQVMMELKYTKFR